MFHALIELALVFCSVRSNNRALPMLLVERDLVPLPVGDVVHQRLRRAARDLGRRSALGAR